VLLQNTKAPTVAAIGWASIIDDLRWPVAREHFPLNGQKAPQRTPKFHLHFLLLAVLLLLAHVEPSAAFKDKVREFDRNVRREPAAG
jgi:hypothetical protein